MCLDPDATEAFFSFSNTDAALTVARDALGESKVSPVQREKRCGRA
jgi:hypothetical protein